MLERDIRFLSELIDKSGVSRPTLTRIYYGTSDYVHLDTLARLCHALDCQPGELLALVSEEGQAVDRERH